MAQTTLTHHQDSLTVDNLGGRIGLTLANHLILTHITRGDGKPGNTHPCTPIFGPDRNQLYGLSQHGNTRNEICDVQKLNDTQIEVSHPICDPGYPEGTLHHQLLSLYNGIFTCVMTHTNSGSQPVALNSGSHAYFDTPQSFKGTTVNGLDLTDIITSNKDGVAIDLQNENLIQIPGKPPIYLTQQGFPKAMVWVGSNPDTGEKDTDYICIEPCEADPNSDFFGSSESYIQPGASRSARFTLSLNP